MNQWGPEGCRERLDEIVGWLEGEAKKRRWKYVVAVPGSRYFTRRMVLGAIEKAEAALLVNVEEPQEHDDQTDAA